MGRGLFRQDQGAGVLDVKHTPGAEDGSQPVAALRFPCTVLVGRRRDGRAR
jgi:hypothetical protein